MVWGYKIAKEEEAGKAMENELGGNLKQLKGLESNFKDYGKSVKGNKVCEDIVENVLKGIKDLQKEIRDTLNTKETQIKDLSTVAKKVRMSIIVWGDDLDTISAIKPNVKPKPKDVINDFDTNAQRTFRNRTLSPGERNEMLMIFEDVVKNPGNGTPIRPELVEKIRASQQLDNKEIKNVIRVLLEREPDNAFLLRMCGGDYHKLSDTLMVYHKGNEIRGKQLLDTINQFHEDNLARIRTGLSKSMSGGDLDRVIDGIFGDLTIGEKNLIQETVNKNRDMRAAMLRIYTNRMEYLAAKNPAVANNLRQIRIYVKELVRTNGIKYYAEVSGETKLKTKEFSIAKNLETVEKWFRTHELTSIGTTGAARIMWAGTWRAAATWTFGEGAFLLTEKGTNLAKLPVEKHLKDGFWKTSANEALNVTNDVADTLIITGILRGLPRTEMVGTPGILRTVLGVLRDNPRLTWLVGGGYLAYETLGTGTRIVKGVIGDTGGKAQKAVPQKTEQPEKAEEKKAEVISDTEYKEKVTNMLQKLNEDNPELAKYYNGKLSELDEKGKPKMTTYKQAHKYLENEGLK